MNTRQTTEVAQGSLLDRLIDDGRVGDFASLSSLREGLRRDLESLLNTRRRFLSPPPDLDELPHSLITYGLPDMTNGSVSSSEFRELFIADVERVLRRCEPRITSFEVMLLDNNDALDRVLRFRIVGLVNLGGEQQELHFDSHVDPVRAGIVIRD